MANATVTDKPTFESVYLLTQRNAEMIQKLGENLDAIAVRDEERRIEAAKRDQQLKAELDKAIKDSNRRINKLDELFTSQCPNPHVTLQLTSPTSIFG